jgi:hypothetical protein
LPFRTAVIPSGYRRHLESIPPVGALLVSAALRVLRAGPAVLLGVVLPHVDVARGHPDGVVDDAVHDRLGRDVGPSYRGQECEVFSVEAVASVIKGAKLGQRKITTALV